MIRVRILGSGLIPRGGGLAPRKEPTLVDFNYLTILMYTRSLRILYQDPDTMQFHDMTLYNFKKIYDKISPKVDAQLRAEEEAKRLAAEKAKVEAAKVVEETPAVIMQEQRQQSFSKKDKFFKKNRFDQKQKHQEIVEEVKVEEKAE